MPTGQIKRRGSAFQRAEALVGKVVYVDARDCCGTSVPLVNGRSVTEVRGTVNAVVRHMGRVTLEVRLHDDSDQDALVPPERVRPSDTIEIPHIDLVAILDRAALWHRPVSLDGDLTIGRLRPEELYRFFVAAAHVFPGRPQAMMELAERVKVYAYPNETRFVGVRVPVLVTLGKVKHHWTGAYEATNSAGEDLVTADQREAWVHAAR